MPRFAMSELLKHDVGSHGFHGDAIAVPEVVPEIELVEVEGDVEGGEGGRQIRCPQKRQGKIGPINDNVSQCGQLTGDRGTYKKICLRPNRGALLTTAFVAIAAFLAVVG
jgi:hypothetical protein